MEQLRLVLLAGCGAALGGMARYGTTLLLRPTPGQLPLATLAVNVLGCVAIGWLIAPPRGPALTSESAHVLLAVGLLGGFTTFSAFGLETLQLLERGRTVLALSNIGLHLALGLGGVYLGQRLAQ